MLCGLNEVILCKEHSVVLALGEQSTNVAVIFITIFIICSGV